MITGRNSKITNNKSNNSMIIPTIFEEERNGVRSYYDIFSRLLKDRIVFVTGEVNSAMASVIIAELLFLEKENSKTPIQLYIMSPGGSVGAGLAIYDTIQYIKAPVTTIAIGEVASIAAVLLASGTKGMRYALPNVDVMIHQPWVSSLGNVNVSQLKITADFLDKTKAKLIRILSKHTGKSKKQILKDVELDYWMSAEEAKEYGLVDKVINL